MGDRYRKETIRMCWRPPGLEPCGDAPQWKLTSTAEPSDVVYVCDSHLADGLREFGVPARIDLEKSDADGTRD